VLVILLAFSCDIGNSEPVTLTLYSDPDLDGRVTWVNTPDVYSFSTEEPFVAVGDLANDVGFTCAFVSFDVSDVPASAAISSATLRLYQNDQISGESYSDLGPVLVDNVRYSALSVPDAHPGNEFIYALTTGYDIGAGPLVSNYEANTWQELNVIDSATYELNVYQYGKLQFRIYHGGNNNDDESDTDGWAMGEDADHHPELVIIYNQ
jgi:hypothetical protein